MTQVCGRHKEGPTYDGEETYRKDCPFCHMEDEDMRIEEDFDIYMDRYVNFTDSVANHDIGERTLKILPLLHGVLGLGTEVGELMDIVKKYMVYNVPIDEFKIKDEGGDIIHYFTYILKWMKASLRECIEMNEAKCRERFPDGYSHEARANRNRAKEEEAQRKAIGEGD